MASTEYPDDEALSPPLLIWDDDEPPPAWNSEIVLWRSYKQPDNQKACSMPEWVDQHADELRRQYLAWVYQAGATLINGKSLVDCLELRAGLSYWWMTQIAQKDVYATSPHIYDAIKLFAFEKFAHAYGGRSVRLHSSNRELSRVLRLWCRRERRGYEYFAPPQRAAVRSPRALYLALPAPVRASLSFLKFIAIRLPSLFRGRATPQVSSCDVAIFDIFTHLDAKQAGAGIFESGYWTKLSTFLTEANISVAWGHWFYKYPAVPDLRKAASLAASLTKPKTRQYHQLIDYRVSINCVARVVKDFIKLNVAALSMRSARKAFLPESTQLDLWPLFNSDWTESVRGPKGIGNLFYVNILQDYFRDAPHYKLGVYIQENQPWEYALIHFWKAHGHGSLVGVPHSTLPYWDLRYAHDPRSFHGENALPRPDLIALNGANAIATFATSGYPVEIGREVEALRYLYLGGMAKATRPTGENGIRTVRLLVLGDLLPQYTEKQISFIEQCVDETNTALKIVFKPHPAAAPVRPIRIADVRISNRHIADELQDCDAVFTGSATSSAADAYQIGVPVISINDGHKINFSPLYKVPGVSFVDSPGELASALDKINPSPKIHPAFFTIDESLPRWRRLFTEALA